MMLAADPGELVAYGPLLVAVPGAMTAGLLSFLSPCCLPVFPATWRTSAGPGAPMQPRRALPWELEAPTALSPRPRHRADDGCA